MRRRRGYALSAALLLAAALGHPSRATAAPNDEDAAPNDEDVAAMKPPQAAAATPKQWPASVPQFRWWEYAGTAALLGGSLALRFTVDVSGEPTWRGGILHDEVTYQTLLVESDHQAYGPQTSLGLPRQLGPRPADLFHSPFQVLPRGLNCPTVLTMHDVFNFTQPNTSNHSFPVSWVEWAYFLMAIPQSLRSRYAPPPGSSA